MKRAIYGAVSAIKSAVVASTPQYFIQGSSVSPYAYAYPFSTTTGFGSVLSTPAAIASNVITGITINSTTDKVHLGGAVAGNYQTCYNFTSAGFGSKLTNPAGTGGTGTITKQRMNYAKTVSSNVNNQGQMLSYPFTTAGLGTAMSGAPNGYGLGLSLTYDIVFPATGNVFWVACQGAATLNAFAWSDSTGIGTSLGSPTGASSYNQGLGVGSNGTGSVAYLASQVLSGVAAWQWSGSSWGTKYANPASGTGLLARSITGNATSTGVFVGTDSGVSTYNWSDATGWGTKITNPAGMQTTTENVSFNTAQDAIAYGSRYDATLNLAVYPISGLTFGTRYTNPSPLNAVSAQVFGPI